MTERNVCKESGQTAVLVALAVVALLAFAGLAIDGGAVYLQRRQMQNAADAAALAGTRQLSQIICDHDLGNDADIAAEVVDYAQRNGVEDPSAVTATYAQFVDNELVSMEIAVGSLGAAAPPQGAAGIIVTTSISRPTYFLGLVGQSTAAASATASAATGPLLVAGGLRPIGLPAEMLAQLSDGDAFTIDMSNNCKNEGDCVINYIRDGHEHMTYSHRGWMNLAYVWNATESPTFPRAKDPNIGTGWGQEYSLMNMMTDPDPGLLLYADCMWNGGCRTGDFVAAKPGQSWGAVNPGICEQITSEISYFPVFDRVVECETQIPTPKPECPKQGGQSVGYVYHIVGFATAQITACPHGQGSHTMDMVLVESVTGQGQVYPPLSGYDSGSKGGCRFGAQVVTLWN